MTPGTLSSTTWVSRHTVTIGSDRAVLSGIMQIVTSTVHILRMLGLLNYVKFPVEQSLGVKLGQPRRLFWHREEVEHPSEAKMRNGL